MQSLDHAAIAGAGEFEQARGERAGDAEGVGHSRRVEPQQMPGGDRAAERPGIARRVKAALLVGVAGGAADPHHDLAAGDKGGDQGPAAETLLLGDREGRGQQGGARMHAGARPGQAVELEAVGQGAVGERRRGRLHRGSA